MRRTPFLLLFAALAGFSLTACSKPAPPQGFVPSPTRPSSYNDMVGPFFEKRAMDAPTHRMKGSPSFALNEVERAVYDNS